MDLNLNNPVVRQMLDACYEIEKSIEARKEIIKEETASLTETKKNLVEELGLTEKIEKASFRKSYAEHMYRRQNPDEGKLVDEIKLALDENSK